MPTYLVALVMFGKTSSQRISRMLNRLRIDYRIVLPHETPSFQPSHIILSGSPKHVYEADHYPMPQWVLESASPVLGICYGMQLIAHTFGGTVGRMPILEKGGVEVTEIINKTQFSYTRWMNRYDQVISVPSPFHITGVTHRNHIAAFTDHNRWWAVQYHPESLRYSDTDVFRRFLQIKPYS